MNPLSRPRRNPVFGIVLAIGLATALGLREGDAAKPAGKGKGSFALSEQFFASGIIPHLRIEIQATNLQALRRDARSYVRAVVREGDTVYEDVGVHLKGAAGSNRDLDSGEPALTLNFDKFRDGQKFHGLDKVHLNNSVQDPSLMCEAICSKLFLDAGVPTARTTHARVTLNGKDLGSGRGLYVLKEGYDKEFLRHHFQSDKGNLYDGGFIREITEDLELDATGGDVPKRADLKALAAAAREPDFSQRMARLESVLDVNRFLNFIALEIMTWHWDGYALKRNNYRVYHDPSVDKIIFIPHGMDQMFWSASEQIVPVLNRVEGLVAHNFLETSEGRRRYRLRVLALMTNVFTAAKLTNHLNELEGRLRPALAAINPKLVPSWQTGDRGAEDLRRKILTRVEFLERRLSEPEPEPVKFDAEGYASLPKWRAEDSKRTGQLDQATDADGTRTLHIAAGTNCVASWRAFALLKRGHYVFEGRVRTSNVVPVQAEPTRNDAAKKGSGAGLRISTTSGMTLPPRTNSVVGDSGWQRLAYEFTVMEETEEPWLICELRAGQGEAWFDLKSLRLRKRQRPLIP